MYWILFITIALLSWGVSTLLEHRFKEYSQVGLPLTGRQVAEKMLRDNGITDVRVTCVSGHLTDHYDPRSKTVNLSDSVYNSSTVAAAAVAAHECGHALQHAFAYGPLRMRSALVPVVSFASKWVTWILLGGILLIQSFPQLLAIGVVSLRNNHFVFVYHFARGNKCEYSCRGLVGTIWHHRSPNDTYGR